MPTPVDDARAAVVAGRMYMPAGCSGGVVGTSVLPSVLCYDLVAGRWDMSCAPMAEARACHGVAALHGEVWAVGGEWWDADLTRDLVLTSVEVHCPRLNTWRPGVPLPHTWSCGACTVVQC